MKRVLTILLIFFVALIIAIIGFMNFNGIPLSKLIPALFGFCLSGIFFVILLPWLAGRYTKIHELAKRTELKYTIRGFLGIFLQWAYFAGTESRIKNNENLDVKKFLEIFMPSGIPNLIEHIKASNRLNASGLFLKDFAKRELQNFSALFPVIVQLSTTHLFYWNLIINHLKGIIESDNDQKLKEHLLLFLMFVEEFDKLSL